MKYGYARVSTDGQKVAAQVAALKAAGAGKVFREVASGAKTERAQLPFECRQARMPSVRQFVLSTWLCALQYCQARFDLD
jgi:predicted site-specific integrase-resolvase